MRNIIVVTFCSVVLSFTLYALRSHTAFAEVPLYPIAELGNCRDRQECFLYCEIPEHKPTCWSYGKYRLPQVLGETQIQSESEVTGLNDNELKSMESDIQKLEQENSEMPQPGIKRIDETKQMEDQAKAYGITFPIVELGNCANVSECREFCNKTANRDYCIGFAKKKGFYKNESADRMKTEYLARMKELTIKELGCDYTATCRDYCNKTENMDRCKAFFTKYSNMMQSVAPVGQSGMTVIELLEKAKLELGCDSLDSCRVVCEQNKQKCMEFTQSIGLYRGNVPYNTSSKIRELPPRPSLKSTVNCENDEQCRKYCSENPGRCPGFPNSKLTPRVSNYPIYAQPSGYPPVSRYPYVTYAPKPNQDPEYYRNITSYPKPTYYPYPSYAGSTSNPTGTGGYTQMYYPTGY